MDSILLISSEAALSEVLASELPAYRITCIAPHDPLPPPNDDTALIIVDAAHMKHEAVLTTWLATVTAPIIHTSRPIRLRELLYTIYGLIQSKSDSKPAVRIAPQTYYLPALRTLRHLEQSIVLTEKEADLLVCLLEQDAPPISREDLLQRVWGYRDTIDTHTLETHIYRLRGKIRQLSDTLDIVSSEGGGYLLARNA